MINFASTPLLQYLMHYNLLCLLRLLACPLPGHMNRIEPCSSSSGRSGSNLPLFIPPLIIFFTLTAACRWAVRIQYHIQMNA